MKSNALRAVRSNDVRAPRFRTIPPPAASVPRRDAAANSANTPKPPVPVVPVVPVGYRQGFITAISVLLAFTLAFWRYWSFESPGAWNPLSLAVEISLGVAAGLQVVALFRSLRVEDDQVPEYRRTQRWLFVSAVVLIAALLGALCEDSVFG
ncbi:hypothetical protein B551_0208185 [Cupriavidus sp. HPC(L)]|uniref:hypothetical protein n=1 Tax=Cupriavidus sp. HPC(L) TaxID=1217418 RepID=UPI000290E115|nr:hypothetical protein B551_0208185 [Cupriavidus sp. HPC(L)]